MRKIDEKAYNAFMNRKRFIGNNTIVRLDDMGNAHMYLFSNKIARSDGKDIYISAGGFRPSVTTRSRLSMFVNISLYKGDFIINNRIKWDGEWTNINQFN